MTAPEIVKHRPANNDLRLEVERLRRQVALLENGDGDLPDQQYDSEYFDGNPTPDDLPMGERDLDYTNGDKYQGETLGDMRHGKGLHTCSNGDVYKGYWRLDKRHGRGMAVLANGMQYEGEWVEDMAHGRGKAKYTNGGRYEGDFKKEHRWGWGLHIFPDGDRYEGQWVDDKIQGEGRHTFLDGSYCEGSWVAGERSAGVFVAGDRSWEYRGQWRGLERHGQGTLFQKGLSKYTGEWAQDLQDGLGTCQYIDGTEHKGRWKAGARHGRGAFTRPGGYAYDGDWAEDCPHGAGSCRFEDGARYEGSWVKGVREGQGKCKYANGDVYDGAWSADVRAGPGSCNYENGDKYTGGWADDKRQGHGTCRFADGSKFSGQWEADAWMQSLADATKSKLGGAGLVKAAAGSTATFSIKAKDELNNRRLCGGDTFNVRLEGLASVDGSVEDHGDGTYTASYTACSAGPYTLSVTNDMEEHVAGSPYEITVVPGPASARYTVISGPGRQAAVTGSKAGFEVEARDAFGNRCEGADLLQALPIEVELEAGPVSCQVSVAPGSNGCYACTYTAETAGSFRLLVTCHGKPIGGSPLPVEVRGEEPAGPDKACLRTPVRDELKLWERKAAAQFRLDGDDAGWDSDEPEEETQEEKYIKAHPDVPVIENMEDMWKVSKLQRERKLKQDLAAAKKAKEEVVAAHASACSDTEQAVAKE